MKFDRSEVEAAYQNFVRVGDSGDWNAWADLHSEDGVWLEHHLGRFEGREAIRKAILEVMKPVPMMVFPVEWHVIEGNRVVYYPW
jgi:ketosteroid isomerase-like protein